MRIRSLLAAIAFLGALAAPGIAAAHTIAYAAAGTTNLRAGPGTNYPIIARVLGGSRVNVLGCLSSRAWCDVVVQDIRGWMAASRLEFVYAGHRVLVPEYYAYFAAPVVSFDFGYWDRHYRDRPWYHRWRDRDDDDRWRDRDDDDDDGWRVRDRDRPRPYTECLAPEGSCPGEEGWDAGWRESGRDNGGRQEFGQGGGPVVEVPTTPPPEPQPYTECLAPDGSCPGEGTY